LYAGRDQALHVTLECGFTVMILAMARVTGDQFSVAAVTLKTCHNGALLEFYISFCELFVHKFVVVALI